MFLTPETLLVFTLPRFTEYSSLTYRKSVFFFEEPVISWEQEMNN
jgi:hypothetical protein